MKPPKFGVGPEVRHLVQERTHIRIAALHVETCPQFWVWDQIWFSMENTGLGSVPDRVWEETNES